MVQIAKDNWRDIFEEGEGLAVTRLEQTLVEGSVPVGDLDTLLTQVITDDNKLRVVLSS